MNAGDNRERLDTYLVRHGLAESRRIAKVLIDQGLVRVNGRRLNKGATVAPSDTIEIERTSFPKAIESNSDLSVPLLYADEAVLIINKPGSMPCHPLRADERETVMNAIAANFPDAAIDRDRPLEGGLVHRLDNGTSGALIIARTPEAFVILRAAIKGGAIRREYLALVAGRFDSAREISEPVAHHPKNPRKMVTGAESRSRSSHRPALSWIVPMARYRDFTLVKVLPRTGSRHQIRVHLASIGHPIVGDSLYGGPEIGSLRPDRFWLHLTQLEFESPAGNYIRVEAPLPPELAATLDSIRGQQKA